MKHSRPVHPGRRSTDARRRDRTRDRDRDGARTGRGCRSRPTSSACSRPSRIRADARVHVRPLVPRPSCVRRLPGGPGARGARRARRSRTARVCAVIFSAHSLPVRTLEDGSQRCKYCDCDDVVPVPRRPAGDGRPGGGAGGARGLPDRVAERRPYRRPVVGAAVEDVIQQLAAQGHTAVVVCCAGFVADHLEILYDLDIEAQAIADEAGIALQPHRDAERRPRVSRRARRGRARPSGRGAGGLSDAGRAGSSWSAVGSPG